jgi:uncharacterized protein (DUF488 family)
MAASSAITIHTIGHSTRTLEELIELLRGYDVERLVDIRRYPGSRRLPHFARESLARAFPDYIHMPELGGRRKPRADSPNDGWRNESFRAYADYMATPEFRSAIDRLIALAREKPSAIMCAEAVPWRCHRNLVSDELVRRGIEVRHITGPGAAATHVMNPMARVERDHLVYPASDQLRL